MVRPLLRALEAACLAVLLAACTPAPPPPPPPSPPPSSAHPEPSPGIEVAVTVDDLPVHGPSYPGIDRVGISDRLLAAFRAHRLPPVYGFVNGKKVDDDPASEDILRRWIAAGNPLGNHTYSHANLNEMAVPDYLADVDRGEAIFKKLLRPEREWKVYRYPYLFEGADIEKRDTVKKALRERGYAIAEVSIDADDWAYNPPFARCSEKHDEAALKELRTRYIEGHVDELHHARALTRALVQRDIKHVLLLHIGAADADAIDGLLGAYEREGVRFIELGAAMSDPFYALEVSKPSRAGSAFPYVLARSRGVKLPWPRRDDEDVIERMCR